MRWTVPSKLQTINNTELQKGNIRSTPKCLSILPSITLPNYTAHPKGSCCTCTKAQSSTMML